MMAPMKKYSLSLALAAVVGLSSAALGSDATTRPLKHMHASWEGVFGHYEQDQLQRGYQVYREVCSSCHSMHYVAFRHLGQKGGPFYMEKCPEGIGLPENTDCSDPIQNPIVKSHAADFQVTDGPDDSGDMFQRPGLPSDYFPSPYENAEQAKAANGGAVPPDMSLLIKARHHGTSYIYSLLSGYEPPPDTIAVPPGKNYNPYYPGETHSLIKEEYLDHGHVKEGIVVPEGGVFNMKAPLSDGLISYEQNSDDDTSNDVPETVDQYAQDVVAFLNWASEPHLEERKTMGRYVLLYLFMFAGIVYVSYRQIWHKLH